MARAGTVLLFLYIACVVQWNSLFLSSYGQHPVVSTQIDTHFKVIKIKTINRIVTEIASYFVLNCCQGFFDWLHRISVLFVCAVLYGSYCFVRFCVPWLFMCFLSLFACWKVR